jgi:hypothetical protein
MKCGGQRLVNFVGLGWVRLKVFRGSGENIHRILKRILKAQIDFIRKCKLFNK